MSREKKVGAQLSQERMHELAVESVTLMRSEDKTEQEKGWEIGLELYEAYEPVIRKKHLKNQKVKVDIEVWDKTIKNEGWEDLLAVSTSFEKSPK
jgi:hypothetical protein